MALALVIWMSRRLNPLLESFFSQRIHTVGIQSFQIVRAESIWIVLRAALSALRILAILAAAFAYLDFVLSRFPWTREFANRLGEIVLRPSKIMGHGLIGYIPTWSFSSSWRSSSASYCA
ncbi:MAG: hypothetical protein IPJ48_18175 [Propionivibrio sp.]|uniref:Uncharacterized protein n=1 Tax=Candidatus Propionivibrio dominans TaxID=2954373 RepID=A0A9D7FIF4_9RHOO|nr:hypothetical protein [Candidatus Propionivibrio dominans]